MELHPIISGFILGLFPIVTMLIMLDFISGLVWLRESQYLQPVLRLTGIIMLVTTGIWASIERDGRRLLGYAVLLETGFALLAVSLQSEMSVLTLFISFIPRMGALALLSLSFSIFQNNGIVPNLENLDGMIRRFPFASIALIFSLLSMAGCPLLAGFPIRLALLEQLAENNLPSVVWSLFGSVLFLLSVIRFLTHLSIPIYQNWQRTESIGQVIFLTIGMIVLILTGILPNLFGNQLEPLFMNLPILR